MIQSSSLCCLSPLYFSPFFFFFLYFIKWVYVGKIYVAYEFQRDVLNWNHFIPWVEGTFWLLIREIIVANIYGEYAMYQLINMLPVLTYLILIKAVQHRYYYPAMEIKYRNTVRLNNSPKDAEPGSARVNLIPEVWL